MPKLNEYLGSIVAGITDARMISDLQTVRVAQEYAKHPLLEHFAVPRMRIEDVELTIPIAVDSLSERSESSFEPIDNEKFGSMVFDLFAKAFDLSPVSDELFKIFREEIAHRTRQLEQELRIVKSLDPLRTFTGSVSAFLLERPKEFGIEKLIARRGFDPEKIREEIRATLSKEINIRSETKGIESLNIVVEADKLREKKPESLVYIKMKISEEGMEWHKMETGGKIETKLLPE